MPSIYNTIDTIFLWLAFLACMVAVPWVGACIEDLFYGRGGDDDDPDGYA